MKKSYNPLLFEGTKSRPDFKQHIANSTFSSFIILTDENTYKYCYPVISDFFNNPIVIKTKSGEENKNMNTCLQVWDELSKNDIDRKAVVINLGGGIICDMGGFIASTYKRGIDFIHIPTSLLAMCDACIGGKLAVNFNGLKNYIGIFNCPSSILIYPDFLETLPEKYLHSGFAEIIKHAIIADKRFFKEISEINNFTEDIERFILRSIRIKSRIVNLDTLEKGIRKSLNFGHSIGHALESFYLISNPENSITHGEAVAAGMITESYISYKKNFLDAKELNQIITLIQKFYKKIIIDNAHLKDIADLVFKDKKNENSVQLFSLTDGIGKFRINEKVKNEEIIESLKFYQSL